MNFAGAWSNAGTIAITNSTLNLGGSFTTAGLGTLNRTGGTVNLTGELDNTGASFLSSAVGTVRFDGGRILGGTLDTTVSAPLTFSSNFNNRLDGVAVSGTVNFAEGSARVRLENGASLTGTANLTSSGALLAFNQSGTVAAPLTINLDTDTFLVGTSSLVIEGSNAVTLGAGVTVRGQGSVGGQFSFGGTNALTNAGLISADVSDGVFGARTLTILSNNFTNEGTARAINGGTLSITSGTDLTNYDLPTQTLTGGSWVVEANSAATALLLNRAGDIVVNRADLTLRGAGSVVRASPATQLEDTLAANAGALRVLGGRDYPNTSALLNSGILHLGGGTFSAPGLTNTATGEVFGFGTVAIRPTNSGLIRSAGGTLTLSNGIQGGSGTVQVDAGSTLDLSGGASNSSADFLIHNGSAAGSLNLGANDFTVGVDYTNGNFGTGNTFNPRANVAGAGQILAAGGIAQAVTGDVTGGATATPTLTSFGNVHVGDVVTKNYRIANVGASGASLRGAIQTSVNGGNLTDPRLSGTGVTAGSFGAIAPGTDSGDLAVTFSATSAGAISGQAVRLVNNFDNVGEQTLLIAGGAAYRFASPGAHSPEPVNLGNRHVGDPAPSQALTMINTAANDGFSERLNAAFDTLTGGVTASGSFSLLAPGSTDSTSLTVGYSTATAGSKSGTATILLTSDGTGTSGLGTTALTSQTVNVTGSVFRLAVAEVAPVSPVNFGIVHVGDTVSQTLTVTNTATSDGFSESLNGSISGRTGAANGAGLFNQVAPGASSTALSVNIDTTTAGVKTGTVTLGFVSDGLGTSGLGTTALTSQTINVSAQVNNFAAPVYLFGSGPGALSGGGTSYTLDFGTVVVNGPFAQMTLSLANDVASPADSLAGAFKLTPGSFQFANFSNFAGLLAGQSLSTLTVGFTPDTLGGFTGTILLDPRSQNASGFDGALPAITLNITANVVVPEPSAALLLATGSLLVGLRRPGRRSGSSRRDSKS